MADALQYAHDQKLIHRDVKPENMLLGQSNELLLSDFGLATTAHNTSSLITQTMAGTLPYMAPEQIQGQARPASDQYALAITAYEWLAGRRPFLGTIHEIALQHLHALPPPLVDYVPTLSREVEWVVFKALAKDPKERFASVQAFALALEQAFLTDSLTPPLVSASSSPVVASPIPPPSSPSLKASGIMNSKSFSLIGV